MKQLKIEFFHDTICSFCFPMAYTMRQLSVALPQVEIIHRSFALAPTSNDLDRMFGSHKQAKQEIMHHWARANQLDPLHRFNIEGMQQTSFLFPISMPALYACKAMQLKHGEEAYFDLFDQLQHALFVDNKDISNPDVIMKVASALPYESNQIMMNSDQVKQLVQQDIEKAMSYGIHGVPALLINETYVLQGYQSLPQLLNALTSLNIDEVGESCDIEGC